MKGYKTEAYGDGRYNVLTTGPYPRQIGFIKKGTDGLFKAEAGQLELGVFPSKAEAAAAVWAYISS